MNDTTKQLHNQSRQNMSNTLSKKSIADQLADDTEPLTDYMLDDPNIISLEELEQQEDTLSAGDNRYDSSLPVEAADSQSISGHMPDPDTDDDIIATAQQMGIGLDEDDEEPAELNIAEAVEKAEKEHWEK